MSSLESGPSHVRALDGVRGVAVVLVFLFHLRVAGFGAGYLGVDVFFVLSGFLITTLLLGEMERSGKIQLTAFWSRRVRRLFPALVVLLLVVAAVTFLTATFTERRAMRGDLLATTTYVANWHFIAAGSYFENIGVPSPLQHTWSLAIEEQFYLAWPVVLGLLIAVLKRPRLIVAALAGVGAVLSAIALAGLWTPGAVDRAYMGTDARMCEPLIGALAAVLVATPRGRRWIERSGTPLAVAGSLGLAAAVALLAASPDAYFFGGAVAVSVCSAMVVAPLWVGRGGRIERALAWRPVAWLGLVSYGVYLWHWPFVVWLGVGDAGGRGGLVRDAAAVALTVGVAAVSFYAIERPIRRGRLAGRRPPRSVAFRPRLVPAAVPFVMLAVAGTSIAATTVPEPPPGAPVVMLVGDSVPLHLQVAFEDEIAGRGWRLASAAAGACPVTGEVPAAADGTALHEASPTRCPATVRVQDSLVRQMDPDVVVWWDRYSIADFLTPAGGHVLSGSPTFWRLRASALRSAVDRLTSRGARVVFVATEPPGVGILTRCSAECDVFVRFQIDHYRDVTTRWNGLLRAFAERHPGLATFVSVTDVVCHGDEVPCDDTLGGVPARPDGTHYVGAGQDLVTRALADSIAPILGGGG